MTNAIRRDPPTSPTCRLRAKMIADRTICHLINDIDNDISTAHCLDVVFETDGKGSFRIVRELEFRDRRSDQPIGRVDLVIRGALGRTPEVTIDGRLLANNATNGSAGELIEVRTFHERVLDRIRLPVESEVNLTGTETRSVAAGSSPSMAILGITVRTSRGDHGT